MIYKLINILFILLVIFLVGCAGNRDRQEHFNQLAGSAEWQPDKVIETLQIQKGWFIGDLGAGGGYYTYRFAQETGETGKVFAADINPDYLAGIMETARERGLNNVDTILADENDSRFAENSLDLIFIRNTFHHLDNKNEYVKKLVSRIKEGGYIVIIDYKDSGSFSPFGHSVSREEIISALRDTDLNIIHEYTFLEKQYFFVLGRK